MAARKDPQLRQILSADEESRIKGARPDYHYILAYKGDDDTGLAHYLELGYEVVRYEEGGERLKVGVTGEPGSPVEWKGHILCRIQKEIRDAAAKHGGDGWGMGQDYVDMLDKKILHRGGIDALQGGRGMEVFNETKRTETAVA